MGLFLSSRAESIVLSPLNPERGVIWFCPEPEGLSHFEAPAPILSGVSENLELVLEGVGVTIPACKPPMGVGVSPKRPRWPMRGVSPDGVISHLFLLGVAPVSCGVLNGVSHFPLGLLALCSTACLSMLPASAWSHAEFCGNERTVTWAEVDVSLLIF